MGALKPFLSKKPSGKKLGTVKGKLPTDAMAGEDT
jgi:hypothetical protein